MSDKKQHIPQEAKDIFELINTTKSAFFDIAGNGAKIASSAVNNSITITLEATDGKSWDQIAGKLIGTAIDYGAINLITRFKPIKDIVEKMVILEK